MIVQYIYNKLRTAPEFHPASAELFDDFTIEAGDVISLQSDGENYALPVFAQRTVWNGSAMVTVQSQGDKERKPLPALQRKEYGRGRGYYQQQRETEDNFVRFNKFIEDTDERFSRLMTESEWDEAADQSVVTMWSQLTQTAANITAEVTRATTEEGRLSGLIEVNAGNIALKVSKDSVISAIELSPEEIRISAEKINIDGVIQNLSAIQADIANITSGTSISEGIKSKLIWATDSFQLGSTQADWRTIKIGDVKSFSVLGAIPSSTEQDFDHYHSVSFTEGTGADEGKIFLTLGQASSTAGSDFFNIAATKKYRDDVAAAEQRGAASKTVKSIEFDNNRETTRSGDKYTVPILITYSDNTTDNTKTVELVQTFGAYQSNAGVGSYAITLAGKLRNLLPTDAYNAGAATKAISTLTITGVTPAAYTASSYSTLTVKGTKSTGYYLLETSYNVGSDKYNRKFTIA